MSEKVQLKECISKLNFGYNAKTVVYTNSSSDITKLCVILSHANRESAKSKQQR